MQGSPLYRVLWVCLVMGLVGLPLYRITCAKALPVQTVEVAESSLKRSLQLELSATSGPFEFVVSHLGKPVWNGVAGSTPIQKQIDLPTPKEGIELVLSGELNGQSLPAALKLVAIAGDSTPIEKLIWLESSTVDEVLLIQP